MTPEQTVQLINLLKQKRTELQAQRQRGRASRRRRPGDGVENRAGHDRQAASRKPDRDRQVLGINAMDLFATVGWLAADDLPPLDTYLGA